MGPQSRTRTTALALILALSFAAGGAQASTREHSARLKALESQAVIEVLWSWISPFLPSGDGSAAPAKIHSVWQSFEEGCGMDPNGVCIHSV